MVSRSKGLLLKKSDKASLDGWTGHEYSFKICLEVTNNMVIMNFVSAARNSKLPVVFLMAVYDIFKLVVDSDVPFNFPKFCL